MKFVVYRAKSESPVLSAWRDCFDARLSHLIYRMEDIDQLLKLVGRIPERIDAMHRLLELLPTDHQFREKFMLRL